MMLRRLLLLAGFLLFAAGAHADRSYAIRYTTNDNGAIRIIGNTMMTCAASANCTLARNRQANGTGLHNQDFNMVQVDQDGDGTTFNSSSADLSMPAGSTVLWAGLYWGSRSASAQRGQVLLRTPSSFGYQLLNASVVDTAAGGEANNYAGFVDVTSIVQAGGNGTYWLANLQVSQGGPGGASMWGGWGLVVVYRNNTETLKNLTVYDGMTLVTGSPGILLTPAGFLTPASGPVQTRVGTVGYDGDLGLTGDNFTLNGLQVTDANNPANDFYNSSISDLGNFVTTRNPQYLNTFGTDLDTYTAPNGAIGNGASSAVLQLTTGGEFYYPHVISFSTELYVPIVTPNLLKTVTDLNGGELLPGDNLRWTISMTNTGFDTATNLTLTDNIPANTTYVPGSLNILSGANFGAKSDTAGNDQAEFLGSGTPGDPYRVVFRLGAGADQTNGGQLPFGASTALSFDTKLNLGVPAGTVISNTASISYNGQTLSTTTFSSSSSAAGTTVLGAPAIAKSFTPSAIGTGGTSTMKITISNPPGNTANLNNVTFSDGPYAGGLLNATPANAAVVCSAGSTPGTITGGTNGGNTIGMNPGATLAPGGSCDITVSVTAAASGIITNTTGAVASSNGGTGSTATASLSVGKLGIAKAFSPATIEAGSGIANRSTITFTLTNPNPGNATGIAFTDTYPANLVNETPLTVGGTCAGVTTTATAGGNTFNVTGGTVNANSSCTITVQVRGQTGTTLGLFPNATSGVTFTGEPVAGLPSNTATLTIVGAPTATKSFSPAFINTGDVTTLRITVGNPNTTQTLTRAGAVFTDTYPAGVTNTATPTVTLNCTPGSTAAVTGGAGGGNTIGMQNMTLAPGGSCTVTSAVTSAALGTYLNPPAVTPATFIFDNAPDPVMVQPPGAGQLPGATLNVTNIVEPTWTKVFRDAGNTANITSLAAGQNAIIRIDIVNPNGAAGAVTGIAFTDLYPVGMVNAPGSTASVTAVAGTCTGATLTATPGDNKLTVTGLNMSATAGGTCRIEVNAVTTTANGAFFNSTGAMTTTNTPPQNTPASATLQVLRPPVVTKAFTPNSIAPGVSATLTITLSNAAANAISLTGATFTDLFPASVPPGGQMVLFNAVTTTTSNIAGSACGTLQSTPNGGAAWNAVTTGNNGVRVNPGAAATLRVGETCTYTFNVTAAFAGTYTNTTSNVLATGPVALSGTNATADMTVGALGVTKAFSPAIANLGDTVTVTFTIANNTGAARALSSFTDTLPAGLQLASGTVGGTCTGIISNAAPGVTNWVVTGGNIPLAGCTMTIQVTSTNFGSFNNQSSGVGCPTCTVTSPPSNVATLLVNPPPVVSKSFLTPVIGVNGTSRIRIRIQNVNNFIVGGLAFTDVYPAGVVNAAAPAATTTCDAPGGSTPVITAVAGANSVALASGEIIANSACDVEVNVTSATPGSYVNDIPLGAISSSAGSNLNATSATLTVLTPLVVTKTFTPGAIASGSSATLTVRLTNTNSTPITLATPAFTDTYPAQITNATPSNALTTCVGGVVTGLAGAGSLALSGGSVPANGFCDVIVTVTSALAGVWTNPAFTVTTVNAATSNSNAATLSVARLAIAKTFSPNPVQVGAPSTLTFTITNPSNATVTLGSPAFSDALPNIGANNMIIANTAVLTTCGGAQTVQSRAVPGVGVYGALTIGHRQIQLVGGTVPANATCTIAVNVSAPAGGLYNNITTAITDNAGNAGNTASASLTVMASPTVSKSFGTTIVGVNQPSTLTVQLANPNAFPITGAAFTDNYPAGMVNAPAPGAANNCGGSVTAIPGTNSFSFTGGTIPPGSFCNVSVNVVGTSAFATLVNTLPVGAVTASNAGSNTAAASATLTVLLPPTVVKDFPNGTPAGTVPVGTPTQLRIRITNPAGNGANAINGVDFLDTYPGGLVNAAAPAAAIAGAGCTGTAAATAGGASLSVTGMTVPAGTTCTVTVNVQAATSGFYANSTGPIATGNAGTGASASGTLYVMAGITGTKTFSVNPLNNGAAVSLMAITLTNPNPYAVTGVVFTDTFPANVVVGNPVNAATTCGGNLTDPAGGALATNDVGIRMGSVTTGTIPANGSCTVTVNVSINANINATRTNTITGGVAAGNLNTGNAGPGPTISGSITETGGTLAPTIAKAFAPASVAPNVVSTLTFTLNNPNAAPNPAINLAGVAFTDTYPAGVVNATPLTVGGTCGATATAGTVAGGGSFAINGFALNSGVTCTVTVQVVAAAAGSYSNTSGSVTSTTAGGLTGNTASAVLVVLDPPQIAKSFGPATINQGQNSTVTLLLTNDNLVALTGVSFSDTLLNMTIANPPAPTTTCGGVPVFSAPAGGTLFSVSGLTLPARVLTTPGTCTVTFTVTGTVAGVLPNATSGLASNEAGTGPASNIATLTVNAVANIVSGFVYRDANGNGSREAGEDWSAGSAVQVNLVQGGVVVQTLSVPVGGGGYSFANVAYGTYSVIVTNSPVSTTPNAPGGFFFTGPTTGSWPVNVAGAALPPFNFGLAGGNLSRVSGRVFIDNGNVGTDANNGLLDASETRGLVGVGMTLTDCGATSYATASTDAAGSYSFFVPTGATTLCVLHGSPGAYVSTGASVGTTVLPATVPTTALPGTTSYTFCREAGAGACAGLSNAIRWTNVAGNAYLDLNFGVVQRNALQPDNAQSGMPGTVVFYPHTFVAQSYGDVTFSSGGVANPANPLWGETIFRDTNCNGRVDPGEPVITAPISITTVSNPTLPATICIVMRESIPANATSGAQNAVTLSASFNYANDSPAIPSASATVSVIDRTTVGLPSGSDLRLEKMVRNCGPLATHAATCPTPTTGAPVYALFNAAAAGDVVEYLITYTNLAAEALAQVTIQDGTPPFATFVSAEAGALPPSFTACSKTTPQGTAACGVAQGVGGTGAISWTFTGNLVSSRSGTVSFKVLVQP